MEEISTYTAAARFLESIRNTRSANTARTYGNALAVLLRILEQDGHDPAEWPIGSLREETVLHMSGYLRNLALSTEQLYLHAVAQFIEYVTAQGFAVLNVARFHMLIRQARRHYGRRSLDIPVREVEQVLNFVSQPNNLISTKNPDSDPNAYLRALRDRAFLLTLADTGLRVHEACKLRGGDLDWNESRAIVIGKGNVQAVVRFTSRSIRALKDYLTARASLDGASGKQLTALPLFARHDRGAGKKVKPITTATGRNIVRERVRQALGAESESHITPHSFRHYFVTMALRGSGNLKMAQELARHKNIQVTQRYAHLSDDELDRGYYEIFEKDKS